MKMFKVRLGFGGLIALAVIMTFPLHAKLMGYRDLPHEQTPEFSLISLDNQTSSLKDYQGKFIILNFWETYCPHCVKEFRSLESLAQRFKSNLVILAVSSNPHKKDTIKKFITKQNLKTIQFKFSASKEIEHFFKVISVPTTFIISPEGKMLGVVEQSIRWDSLGAIDFIQDLIEKPLSMDYAD